MKRQPDEFAISAAVVFLLFALSCSDDPAGPDAQIQIPEIPQQLNDGWLASSLLAIKNARSLFNVQVVFVGRQQHAQE